MNCARNCENLLNFVKVIPITLLVPFFSGHGVLMLIIHNPHSLLFSLCIELVEVKYVIGHIYDSKLCLDCVS